MERLVGHVVEKAAAELTGSKATIKVVSEVQAVVSVMGSSPSRWTDHLCLDLDPAADSNQTMVPVCRPSQRINLQARAPKFAPRPVGVTTPNGLAWTWKPITCRCKTIIQAAFGLWV